MFLLILAAAVLAQDTGDTADTGVTTVTKSGHIYLTDELDELADGQWYCFDAFGDFADDGDGIQTHTCKDWLTEDQDWTVDSPSTGQIQSTRGVDADGNPLCVETQRIAAKSWLSLVTCNERYPKQFWTADTDGYIHPASNPDLCVAVELGEHGQCGDTLCDNYKRNVTLQTCADIKQKKYLVWTIPGGTIGI